MKRRPPVASRAVRRWIVALPACAALVASVYACGESSDSGPGAEPDAAASRDATASKDAAASGDSKAATGGDGGTATTPDTGSTTTSPDGGGGPSLDSGAAVDTGTTTSTPDSGRADTGTPSDSGSTAAGDASAASSASVLQHHKNASRDGLYVDGTMTQAVAAKIKVDASFAGTLSGAVYAQPLYVTNGPNAAEAYVVATENNHVTAISGSGATIWDKTFGTPVPKADLPCGIIDPLGITGTPVIDVTSRTIYFDAMALQGTTPKHSIYAISLDTGATQAGWPVDVETAVPGFGSAHQNQRGALSLVNGTLYVTYGGHVGDCTPYHGYVVGIPVASPATAMSWSTGSIGSANAGRGGIWSPAGVTTDGTSLYVSTGNTSSMNSGGFSSPAQWSGGEAVFKFGFGPTFTEQTPDYYFPMNWAEMDQNDVDLGGVSPVAFDMAGAAVPHLVVALGKDGDLYLLNRDNLGGMGGELSRTTVASGVIMGAAAVYTTSKGTYVAFRGSPTGCPGGAAGNLGVAKITAGAKPTAAVVWCAPDTNLGSPMVTTTGSGDVIVWDANTRLFGYDGDTGARVYAGGGAGDVMSTAMQYFNAPIAVGNSRMAVAVSGRLYVFTP